MGFSTVEDVVERLVGEPTQRLQFKAEFQQDLEAKILAADALIEARLKPYTQTIEVNTLLRSVSADIAAALFKMDRGELQQAKALIDRAEESLQTQIQTFRSGAFTKT
ncbi:MAG: hypothetical protein QXW32_07270 [Nitrososphaerales archaeon]